MARGWGGSAGLSSRGRQGPFSGSPFSLLSLGGKGEEEGRQRKEKRKEREEGRTRRGNRQRQTQGREEGEGRSVVDAVPCG